MAYTQKRARQARAGDHSLYPERYRLLEIDLVAKL